LIETVARLADTIEFSEQSAIVFEGALHQVNDDRLQDLGLPRTMSDNTRFPAELQEAFQNYCRSITDPSVYHDKTLTIPVTLKRLIVYDPNFISQVVRYALFPKSLKLKGTEFAEQRITLRKYHFARLDAMDIRVPRAFGEICGDKPQRYIKISYLLSIGFDGLVASGTIDQRLADALHPDFEHLGSETDSLPDDDEAWLDSAPKPPHSLEDVGTERAERDASFVSEISGFDSVEGQGPINFDPELFQYRLDHFFDSDSTDDEEEEEEDADEVLGHLDAEDRELFQNQDPAAQVQTLLEQSLAAEAGDRGPMSDLVKLFELGPIRPLLRQCLCRG
jgi:hypothetical protein